MNLRLAFVSFVALASLAGCSTADESTDVSEGELNETPAVAPTPRISADELATKAEAHFAELEAVDAPHPGQAKSTVLFAVDDEATVTVEEAALDKNQAPVAFESFLTTPQLEIQTHTSPVFYVRGGNSAAIGSYECASVPGAAAVLVKIPSAGTTDRYLPRPGDACTISIKKVYPEDFGALASYAAMVHLKPRTIVVGTVSATLHNDAGVAVDVRAAFVQPVRTR